MPAALPRHDDVKAELAARRLREFAAMAWSLVEPTTPFVHSWHNDVIFEHLEAVTEGEIRRLIINQPPRTMKSLTTCVFWPAWEWLRSPAVRWLFATYAADLSVRDSVKCRRLIQSAGGASEGNLLQRRGYQGLLSMLDQTWSLESDQNAKEKYETSATGMRLSTSVGGVATGEGGDRIVVDDPLNAKQARSEAERTAANTWWDETMTTRFNNSQASAVIVMQRLHEKDLTGHLLEKGGWHHLCLPAEYEPKHPFVYPDTVKLPSGRELAGDRRTEPGELLEPIRLDAARLEELAAALGSYGYAGQMQQRPAPAEGGMFKRHWWKRYTTIPPQWQRVVHSWDMRFGDSQKAASSYVVGQVWGIDGVHAYLLGQVRARLSFTDSVKAVLALQAWQPAPAKLIERKANGAAVIDSLSKAVRGLIAIEPEGGKDVRAAAIEPYVEAGNVFLPAGEYIPAPAGYEPTRVDDFIGECGVFPNGAHDDQVDAMTQALNWLEHRGPATVTVEEYRPSYEEPISRDGDLTLRGAQYIDR